MHVVRLLGMNRAGFRRNVNTNINSIINNMSVKMAVFWVGASCSLVETDRRFGDA
jgi:hypothetical protein